MEFFERLKHVEMFPRLLFTTFYLSFIKSRSTVQWYVSFNLVNLKWKSVIVNCNLDTYYKFFETKTIGRSHLWLAKLIGNHFFLHLMTASNKKLISFWWTIFLCHDDSLLINFMKFFLSYFMGIIISGKF